MTTLFGPLPDESSMQLTTTTTPTPAEEYGTQQLLLRLLKANAAAKNPAPLEWGAEQSRAMVRYLERIEAAMVTAGELVRAYEQQMERNVA